MQEVTYLIECLEKTPVILKSLLDQIPADLYRTRRVEGKWSIHEQVCHLTEAQGVLFGRFRQFENEVNPSIKVFGGSDSRSESWYLDMNMDAELAKFCEIRADMVAMLIGYPMDYWSRQGTHEGFTPYNAKLLLTHAMNVDYAHMFSIEQLGLTRPEFEESITTIP